MNKEVKSNSINTLHIEQHIYDLRGEKVMLDSDLAKLYGVETRALVQAMKRNLIRFPKDFAFQITKQEVSTLTSQNVISKRGGRRTMPYAFTEQGVAMLASVLKSTRAVQANIEIVFEALRELMQAKARNKRPIGYIWPKEEKDDDTN